MLSGIFHMLAYKSNSLQAYTVPGHIIQTLGQQIVTLPTICCMHRGEAAKIKITCLLFDLVMLLKPITFYTWGKHANHYTMEVFGINITENYTTNYSFHQQKNLTNQKYTPRQTWLLAEYSHIVGSSETSIPVTSTSPRSMY